MSSHLARAIGTGWQCEYGSLSAEELALAHANFVAYDVDGDGVISREDFRAAMVRHSPEWAAPEKATELELMYQAVDVRLHV